MGSPDAQPEGWHLVVTPEETPHALCQNRPEITRADPPIFGGTFFRPAETRPTVHHRDDLQHPGSAIRSANGGRPGVGRTGFPAQDRIPLMPSTPTTSVVGTADKDALPDGGRPHPGVDAIDLGSVGHQQEVCEENGIPIGSSFLGRSF